MTDATKTPEGEQVAVTPTDKLSALVAEMTPRPWELDGTRIQGVRLPMSHANARGCVALRNLAEAQLKFLRAYDAASSTTSSINDSMEAELAMVEARAALDALIEEVLP